MQTGIDQRGKSSSSQSGSQAANGSSKDEYDYSRAGQGYAPAMSSSAMSDPYAASSFYPAYLSYPTASQGGISEGVWSNGDPMYMGGYGQMNNDMYSGGGLFGGFDYAQMGYSWQYPAGDYSSWNTPSSQPSRKDDPRGYMTDHYYMAMGGMDAYGSANGGGGGDASDSGVHAVEQGLRNVSVGEKRDSASATAREPSATSRGSTSRAATTLQPAKPMTWASVAGKPAGLSQQTKAPPKIVSRSSAVPARDSTASAEGKLGSSSSGGTIKPPSATTTGARTAWSGSRAAKLTGTQSSGVSAESRDASDRPPLSSRGNEAPSSTASVVPRNNSTTHDYNPKDFNLNPKGARFFIIKSYSEDDIHRSIKYRIWCSTDHGNKRLDSAYHERDGKGPVYLFFSVNGSGHFCGMAQMVTPLDYNTSAGVWAQDKWKGRFEVKWIYVKDVPNSQLRHIRLENNENKPVTNSRDTQEVPTEQGKQVLRIVHQYRHTTSIFDDFIHYEKRQEEENATKKGRHEGSDSGTF